MSSSDPSAPRRGSEALRKSVHIAMGGFALSLRWLTPMQAALGAGVALAFNVLVLHRVTGRKLLREGEHERGFSLGIALYPAMVLALVVVFHRRMELAAATWGLLAFGDGMATVAGKGLGGPRLGWNRDKTWSGLVAFVLYGAFTSAFLVRWTQWGAIDAARNGGAVGEWIGLSYFTGSTEAASWTMLIAGCTFAALAAGLAESLDIGVDDNILVPLVGGTALWLGTLVDPLLLAAATPQLGHDFLWGAIVNAILAVAAYATRGVRVSGAVWGWVLGTALYGLAGPRGFSMLLVFFVLGTVMTKVGYTKKAALGIAQEKGGRRGARNAFANVGAGLLFAFLAVATPYTGLFTVALVAAFATAANDTVSSEFGQAFGRRHFLVTTFRRVPPGTDGAVSIEGTLAGIAGGALVAGVAWQLGLIAPAGAVVATAAAFIGATLESYLGATIEGTKQIDNELINFANTIAGGTTAIALASLIA